MNGKAQTWLWTLGVGTLAGAATLYVKAKSLAVQHLNKIGMFKEAQIERLQELRELPQSTATDAIQKAEKLLSHPELEEEEKPQPKQTKQWAGNDNVIRINQRYRNKKQAIIHQHGADNMAGAWAILDGGEKNKALAFSGVTSVVAGGLTYAIAHSMRETKRKGNKHENGNSCGGSGCSYSSHDGGHGGHGCGLGCAGGGCGGGCGS